MSKNSRPRHALDDDYDDYDYHDHADRADLDGYAADYDRPRRSKPYLKSSQAAAGAAGAGAAGAAGAGSTSGVGDAGRGGRSTVPAEEETQGPPIRGLAMILTAVAVLLIAWGAFSFFGKDDDSSSHQAAKTETSEQANGDSGVQKPSSGAQQSTPPAGDKAREGEKPAPQPSASAPEGPAGNNPAGAEAPAAGAANGQVNKADTYVTVLNNSPVSGLAGDTAKKLHGDKWAKTGFGNLADADYVFQESTVLYPKNDANARAAAEQVAKDLGVGTKERTPEVDASLPKAHMLQGPPPAAVVVVTTNDMKQ